MSFFKSIFGRIFAGGKRPEAEKAQARCEAQSIENSIEAEAPLTLTIWTIERNRHAAPRALCTEIEVYPSEALGLHEEIYGYVIDAPNGESVVVEAKTGSLVGHSLEVVRDGVREMTRAQLNIQLETGRREFNRMKKQELSNDEFWVAIRMGSSEIEVIQDFQE